MLNKSLANEIFASMTILRSTRRRAPFILLIGILLQPSLVASSLPGAKSGELFGNPLRGLGALRASAVNSFSNQLTLGCTSGKLTPQVSQTSTSETAIQQTERLIREIIKASYPELANTDVRVKTFSSKSDYFRSSFSFQRFLFGVKMRYVIKVNPRLFDLNAPADGIRAILAHELGHLYDFKRKNRLRLFGLVRLASKSYTARFERWTDLQAIARGYGDGLKAYRIWLYVNIPADKLTEKSRNYFSPEEIDLLQAKLKQNPALLQRWLSHVPMSLDEIESAQ